MADELPAERGVPTDLGVDLPMWLIVTVFLAEHYLPAHMRGVERADTDGAGAA